MWSKTAYVVLGAVVLLWHPADGHRRCNVPWPLHPHIGLGILHPHTCITIFVFRVIRLHSTGAWIPEDISTEHRADKAWLPLACGSSMIHVGLCGYE
ncbi:hypothetical protein C7974DRAFT_51148 [Boeremia exigua]|uniref:uncharacterized protein n=1 Tax=Boeremia exigua TaxID=749465 RepID=UPI001E8E6A08|nr:uncharacterized protein C7974DRAFT_51148 [Boeremia exigua]KAH6616738.1 hypothetical protein C7974DRAFT_51148 [Boeremia exigua]